MANGRYNGRGQVGRKRGERKSRCAYIGQGLLRLCVFVVLTGTILLSVKAVGRETGGQGAPGGQKSTVPEVRETAKVMHEWKELPRVEAIYSVCPAGSGWSHFYRDNTCAMAAAGSYLTAVKATLKDQPEGMTGTIEYSVNLSGSGWLDWSTDAAGAGQESGDAALEAIRVRLTGEMSEYYDVLYCVLQDGVWTDWVKNGEESGRSGMGLHMDGIRVSVARCRPGQETYAGEIDATKPMVALTYDDGPSRDVTPRILDKLEECGGHATFFMVGQQAERRPETVSRMAKLGCEVANHTYGHVSMNKLQPQELVEQISRTNQLVYDICGITPGLMRPVGGNENDIGLSVVGTMGMPAILWSVDTLDWKTRDAASTFERACGNVKDGDIILMHDLYGATGDASVAIIDELVRRGYQLVTVSELSAYRGGLVPGKSYAKFRP